MVEGNSDVVEAGVGKGRAVVRDVAVLRCMCENPTSFLTTMEVAFAPILFTEPSLMAQLLNARQKVIGNPEGKKKSMLRRRNLKAQEAKAPRSPTPFQHGSV